MKIISTLLISFLMATEIAPLATDVNPLQVIGHKLDKSLVVAGKEVTVVLEMRLLPGFHAYSDKFKIFSLLPDGARLKDVVVSPVVQFVDFSGKNHQGIEGDTSVTFKVDLPQDATVIEKLQYEISYIACTPKFCLPPKEVMAFIPITEGKPSLSARLREKMSGAIHLETDLEAQLSANLAFAYLIVFLFGVLASLTPCIYPVIPITLAVIGTRAAHVPRYQAFLLSFVHVLGIATTYSVLGVIAAKTGALFGQSLSYPAVSIVFALIFLTMALSLFGFFEIRAPHFVTQRLSKVGQGKGFVSVFVTGLVAGVIASPCVGPMLVSILAYIAKTQNAFLGLTLLFTFAMGMGVLLIVLGTFSSLIKNIPRSGPWMNGVKWTLAVLMLIGSFYYAQLAYAGLQKDQSESGKSAVKYEHGWEAFSEAKVEQAKAAGKPVIIDFYADWCAACVELDKQTFPKPEVIAATKNFTLLRVDATESFKGLSELQKKYNVFGLPTIVCLSPKGEFQKDLSLLGFEASPQFIQRLDMCRSR